MTEYEELSIALLGEILGQLKQLNAAAEVRKPFVSYTKRIEDYPSFDWESIGAVILDSDDDGVCQVEHKGEVYSRRSPTNKFAPAIWFSRSAGKDSDGENQYVRLITFKKFDFEPEPIHRNTKKLFAQPAPRQVAPPPEPPAVVTENISREQATTIHKELKGAGIDSTVWMVEQGYKRLGMVQAKDYDAVLAAAKASAKAAQDPAVLAAKSLAGAMGGEVMADA
jgi:hypothetical protein